MNSTTAAPASQDVILSIKNLCKEFRLRSNRLFGKPRILHALSDVSLDVYRGETLGIIGESGCGKSTLGRCIVHLHRPTSGQIVYGGRDISWLKGDELKNVHKDIQMVFQDSYSSLDPRFTAAAAIEEPMKIYGMEQDKRKRQETVLSLMQEVGLDVQHLQRYPHEFSGGQRQRIGIARAIIMNPELIVADEPVSALDVSVQAQVINLLNDLTEQLNLTLIFIAHNLSVVKYFCDRIAVMYYGNLVELATSEELFEHPLHPYTKSLLSAVPYPDPIVEENRHRIIYVPERDHDYSKQKPTYREIVPGHFVSCNDEEAERYLSELKG